MNRDYFTRKIVAVTQIKPDEWRVTFSHYEKIRSYTTKDADAVTAFLHPETINADNGRFKTIHDAAKFLYYCGVTICGYYVRGKRDK